MFKPGQIVQSRYNASRWYGVVTAVKKRSNNLEDIVRVLVTHDRAGNKQRKKFIRELNELWLSPATSTGLEDEKAVREIRELFERLG